MRSSTRWATVLTGSSSSAAWDVGSTLPDDKPTGPLDPPKEQLAKSDAAHKAAMDNPANNAEAYVPLEWGWRQQQSRFNL